MEESRRALKHPASPSVTETREVVEVSHRGDDRPPATDNDRVAIGSPLDLSRHSPPSGVTMAAGDLGLDRGGQGAPPPSSRVGPEEQRTMSRGLAGSLTDPASIATSPIATQVLSSSYS